MFVDNVLSYYLYHSIAFCMLVYYKENLELYDDVGTSP